MSNHCVKFRKNLISGFFSNPVNRQTRVKTKPPWRNELPQCKECET